jgi:hypothetical protein
MARMSSPGSEPEYQTPRNSVEPDWNQAPTFGRRQTLLRTLPCLYALHPGPACIVETGTIRDDRETARSGDGWSTLAWGWYAAQTGGRAYTVDCDPDALALCRRLTSDYADHLEYVQADSLALFADWTQRAGWPEIHLLYLDSLDYVDQERSEEHHLAEARAALPLLARTRLPRIRPPTAFPNASPYSKS